MYWLKPGTPVRIARNNESKPLSWSSHVLKKPLFFEARESVGGADVFFRTGEWIVRVGASNVKTTHPGIGGKSESICCSCGSVEYIDNEEEFTECRHCSSLSSSS